MKITNGNINQRKKPSVLIFAHQNMGGGDVITVKEEKEKTVLIETVLIGDSLYLIL